jgi:CRP/FNR family transcriptional regulator, cyclic AMP receptor protein
MKPHATQNEVALSTSTHVRVLDHDPELARGLDPKAFAVASRHLVAATFTLEPGEWERPFVGEDDRDASIGILVIDGLLMRTQTVATVGAAELLGAGDLLRPWESGAEGSSLGSDARWQVLHPSLLAVLDRRFAQIAGRWPEVTSGLVERTVQRGRLLAFQMGVGHVRRVDARLLLLMWRLADRWGRVTREGVVLPLKLTHGWLANLVGAQRPSVTTALGQLAQAGRLERLENGSWLLRGDPPDRGDPLFQAGPGGPPA